MRILICNAGKPDYGHPVIILFFNLGNGDIEFMFHFIRKAFDHHTFIL